MEHRKCCRQFCKLHQRVKSRFPLKAHRQPPAFARLCFCFDCGWSNLIGRDEVSGQHVLICHFVARQNNNYIRLSRFCEYRIISILFMMDETGYSTKEDSRPRNVHGSLLEELSELEKPYREFDSEVEIDRASFTSAIDYHLPILSKH